MYVEVVGEDRGDLPGRGAEDGGGGLQRGEHAAHAGPQREEVPRGHRRARPKALSRATRRVGTTKPALCLCIKQTTWKNNKR